LVEVPIWLLLDKAPTDRKRFPAANGGLFSTIEDYARFCRMLLGRGQLDGVRVLTEQSVALFHSPAIEPSLVTGFTPGNTWGLGCCIVREPQGVTAALSSGSYGHGGAFGTQAWIDPHVGRCYLLMVQRANFPNADASELRSVFQQLASQSLESKAP
jgi:CubicO group peptidase (beta-lactamase class C family)